MFFVLGIDLRSIFVLPSIVVYPNKASCEIRWLILVFAFGFRDGSH